MKSRKLKLENMISQCLMVLSVIICMGAFCSASAMSKPIDNLYMKVMQKLEFEPSIDASNITIAIKDDNIVVLGGKVESYTEKRLAEEAVKKIKSVKGVANEIEVELSLAYERNDIDIVEAALNVLKWTMLVPHEKIKVVVDKGHLTLSGEVKYNYQREWAEEAVSDLYGVTMITNNIILKSDILPSEVKNRILKEFERNAYLDSSKIQVEVDGNIVTLKGIVSNFEDEDEAIAAAWSVPGVAKVIDQLEIISY